MSQIKTNKALGKFLETERKKRGLKLRDVGAITKRSVSQISNIETGIVPAPIPVLKALGKTYKISPQFFINALIAIQKAKIKKKFLATLVLGLGIVQLAFAQASSAYTSQQKHQVLNALLQMQTKQQNSDDKELQAIIDSLLSSGAQPLQLDKKHYEAALNNLLNKQEHAPNDRATAIMIDALTNRISKSTSVITPVRSSPPVVSRLDQKESAQLAFFRSSGIIPGVLNPNGTRKTYQSAGKNFLRYWNRGDGDCGLHGLGVTRAELVRRVNASFKTDLEIRNSLRDGVYNDCLATHQANPASCDSLFESSQDQANQDKFSHYINNKLSSQSEYMTISTGPAPENKPMGLLAVAAKLFHKNVRVWRQGPGGITAQFNLSYNPGSTQVDDLILEGSHYDSLIEASNTEKRMTFLDKEQQNVILVQRSLAVDTDPVAVSTKRSSAKAGR